MGGSSDRGIAGGILRVANTVSQHRHAVVRDLNSLGYQGDTRICLDDFVSNILASPPGSAVRYSVDGGWSQTDQLLANLGEQQAGLTNLPDRYPRPGIENAPDPGPIGPDGNARMTAGSIEEFGPRMERLRARARSAAEAEQSIAAGRGKRV